VTTDDIVGREDFVSLAASVMRAAGPRGAIHVRGSALTARRVHDVAAELAHHQETTGAWLVVNDRVDVALAVGARGLQLTTRSLSLEETWRAMARSPSAVPRPSIGASVHTAAEARAAAAPVA